MDAPDDSAMEPDNNDIRFSPVSFFPAFSPDPITDGSAVLTHDGFDVRQWEDALADYPRLNQTLRDNAARLATSFPLFRDLFWSFLKRVPRADPVVPLTPAHRLNRQIVEQVLATVEWKQTRTAGTVGDPLAAAMATIGVAEKVIAVLDWQTCEQVAALHEAESGISDLFARADSLEELAAQASGDRAAHLFQQAQAARAQARNLQENAESLADELDDTLPLQGDRIRRTARHALADAETEVDTLHAAYIAFGGDAGRQAIARPGSSALSTKDKIALATRVNRSRRLQEIAALCGRMMRIAFRVQASRILHPPDEVTSIELGSDLAHLLPSELALLADPDLEELFLLRFAEQRLLQYALIGNEKQGQGPIIVALDSSGSMHEVLQDISKEAWSKAVMLALLAIARKQRRDCAVIHFGGSDRELSVFHFPKGQSAYPDVLACTETFFGGGTLFEPWMTQALALVDASAYQRADVICITDGLAAVSARARTAWQERRQQRDMRAYGVLVGTRDGAGVLASLTDAMMTLDDLTRDSDVLETIFNV